YDVEDAPAFIQSMRQAMEQMDGVEMGPAGFGAPVEGNVADGQSMKMAVDYQEAAAEIEGVQVDLYQSTVEFGADAAAEMGPMAGLANTTGYIAPLDGRVLVTTQPDQAMVGSAIRLSRGAEGEAAFGTEQRLRQLHDAALPEDT